MVASALRASWPPTLLASANALPWTLSVCCRLFRQLTSWRSDIIQSLSFIQVKLLSTTEVLRQLLSSVCRHVNSSKAERTDCELVLVVMLHNIITWIRKGWERREGMDFWFFRNSKFPNFRAVLHTLQYCYCTILLKMEILIIIIFFLTVEVEKWEGTTN
jgi:hypothetical protein